MTKKYLVALSEEQRRWLEGMVRRGRDSASKITRARILLLAGAGRSDPQIAQALAVGRSTVERVRRRFAQEGPEAAVARRPQPPRPQRRKLDGAAEARLITLACSQAPAGHGHWTLDLLADRLVQLRVVPAVSRDTVRRVLKKTSLSLG